MDQYNNNNNNININMQDNISSEILYQLHSRINQSIVIANEGLMNNFYPYIINNINMYDYFINKNNLDVGEYAFIAYDTYNKWYVRKTFDNIIQYYQLKINDYILFELFIDGYQERYYS